MQIFKSKIDLWIGFIIAVSAFLCAAISLPLLLSSSIANVLIAVLILGLGSAFPIWLLFSTNYSWLLFSTNYSTNEKDLLIKCGPFRWVVPLATITSVKETKNPLSSPALSLDRLQISYQSGKSIMVSPKDKQRFISAINQEI